MEVKAEYASRPITGGEPREEQVCEARSETAAGKDGAERSRGVCGDLLQGGQPWVVLTESLFVDESAAALGSTRTERRGQ